MDVHSVLLPGNFVLGTLSFLGRDRVNNLLKDRNESDRGRGRPATERDCQESLTRFRYGSFFAGLS